MEIGTIAALTGVFLGICVAFLGFFPRREGTQVRAPGSAGRPYLRFGFALVGVAIVITMGVLAFTFLSARLAQRQPSNLSVERGYSLLSKPGAPLKMDLEGSLVLSELFSPDDTFQNRYWESCGVTFDPKSRLPEHRSILSTVVLDHSQSFNVSLVPVKSPSFEVTPISQSTQQVAVSGRFEKIKMEKPMTFLWQVVAHDGGHQVLAIRVVAEIDNHAKNPCDVLGLPRKVVMGYDLLPVIVATPLFSGETINALITGLITLLGSSGFALIVQAFFPKLKSPQ